MPEEDETEASKIVSIQPSKPDIINKDDLSTNRNLKKKKKKKSSELKKKKKRKRYLSISSSNVISIIVDNQKCHLVYVLLTI